MGYLIAILLAYLLGSSSMTWYLGKLQQIDPRTSGTGNLGASNAAVLLGWGAGVLVGIHDVGKGFLSVVLVRWLFPDVAYVGELAGVACVLGHIFPFYLGFRGGKGLAAFMGVIWALNLGLAVVALVLLVLVTAVSDYIALGTLTVAVAAPVGLWAMTGDAWASLVLCAGSAVIILKHMGNLRRIAAGKEIGLRSTIKGEHRVK